MTGAETGTPPPADLVARVFELGAVREPPTFAARGELGFVWRLSTDRGTWAVKVLLDPVTAATGGDAAFQLALHAAGLPLPRPRLARTGSAVITGPDGVGYRLYEWLDLDPGRRVEPDTAGHLLGRIHATAWPAHEVAPWFHEPVPDDTWRGLIDAARAAGEPWCEPLASRLDEILATTAAITPGPPPQMIGCHLDFNHDNVLVDLTGRPWVIDWENSGGGDPLQELAQSLHEFAGGDSDAARAMLAAYRAAGARPQASPSTRSPWPSPCRPTCSPSTPGGR